MRSMRKTLLQNFPWLGAPRWDKKRRASDIAFAKQEGKTVCPNCGQWQHPRDGGQADCFNECKRRGFAS